MQQRARTTRGWRQWTGRVLPVLAVALLALGPAHGKDKDKKKKQREAEVAAQVERQAQAERAVRAEKTEDEGSALVEQPALVGKKSKNAPPVQNMREPSRAEPRAERRIVSEDRVIAEIERRYKAKVVRSEPKRVGDKQVYELRLLSEEGRVWTVRVDAETGKEI
jgi:uncharacterized membrane protein YkoI